MTRIARNLRDLLMLGLRRSTPDRGTPARGRRRFWLLLACTSVLGALPTTLPGGAPPPASVASQQTTTVAPQAAPLPTGEVLRRTLQDDSRQEYILYVPPAGGVGSAIFVSVHGISRNAEEHARRFAPHAQGHGVVLVAPLFSEERFEDYQRLGRRGLGRRADLALESILEEVAALTGASKGKIHLFGFSGGAQFAHRFTMAYPERVARAVIGSPGWYTFPDAATPYPYGIGPSHRLADVDFEPQRFLRVPILVLVGEADTTNQSLRRNDRVDRQQGTTRLQRARSWVAAMRLAAADHHCKPMVTLEEVAGIGHSFSQFAAQGQLGERVFEALFGTPSPPSSGTEADAVLQERRHGMGRPGVDAEWTHAGGVTCAPW